MASRLIHYLIGTEIMKRVPIENKNRFMAGNLYPDCVDGPGGRKGKKGRSHFYKQDGTHGICWETFFDKYQSYMQDELYEGYFCHLLTDILWYKEVGNLASDISKMKKIEIMYRDYHRLNELLREDYSLTYSEVVYEECEIEEIEPDFWDTYIQCLREDFMENTGAEKKDLELIDYDAVTSRIINRAVELCSEKLKMDEISVESCSLREWE